METSNTYVNRGYCVGLAIGQIWLAVISTSFVSILWILGQNAAQIALILGGVILGGLVLLGAALALLRDALRLPIKGTPEEKARSRAIGRKMGLRFGVIVFAEIVITGALNAILSQTNHGDWIVPVVYFIVGLHFIPLAFVFHVRVYNVLGVAWVVITVLTVLLTSADSLLGQGTSAWVFWPLVGCGSATWITLAYVLTTSTRNVRRALRSPVLA